MVDTRWTLCGTLCILGQMRKHITSLSPPFLDSTVIDGAAWDSDRSRHVHPAHPAHPARSGGVLDVGTDTVKPPTSSYINRSTCSPFTHRVASTSLTSRIASLFSYLIHNGRLSSVRRSPLLPLQGYARRSFLDPPRRRRRCP